MKLPLFMLEEFYFCSSYQVKHVVKNKNLILNKFIFKLY